MRTSKYSYSHTRRPLVAPINFKFFTSKFLNKTYTFQQNQCPHSFKCNSPNVLSPKYKQNSLNSLAHNCVFIEWKDKKNIFGFSQSYNSIKYLGNVSFAKQFHITVFFSYNCVEQNNHKVLKMKRFSYNFLKGSII